MRTLPSLVIFLRTSSSSASNPYLLSYHCLFVHPSSNSELERKTGRISQFSSSLSSNFSSSSRRQYDEESRNVKVSVWWDFENCNVPSGVNVFKVAHNITAALRTNGIKGPVTITAFGDVLQLSRSKQEALSSTGICINHIPNGGTNSSDRSLLVDLVYWVSQNPPPAHLFLISGDRDFANVLHRLRMNNYNILVSSQEFTPGVLCSAASIMWHWNALVRGENLIGVHFNQPPDGPYGSWYGHYKGFLKDPFSNIEQASSSRPEDSLDTVTDSKVRVVPKGVVDQICQILNTYPMGITITGLRSELAKNDVPVDKDYYGHKRFFRMLSAMPSILKLEPTADGMLLVQGINLKVDKPIESNSEKSKGPESSNGDRDLTLNADSNVKDHSIACDVSGKSSLRQVPSRKVEGPPSQDQKEIDVRTTVPQSIAVEKQESTSEIGVFQRMWRTFGYKHGVSNQKSNSVPVKYSANGDNSEKEKYEDKCAESIGHRSDTLGSCSSSSINAYKPVMDAKTAQNSEENGDKSKPSRGFFNAILNWCQFWGSSPSSVCESKQCSEELNQITYHSLDNELFSKKRFWTDIASFIDTPKGSVLVCRSRTREQLSQNLQKEGPFILSSLNGNDLLHLVDLLISEKKWLEECPSQTFPFKPIQPATKRSSPIHPSVSNGLSSIFLGKASESKPERQPEHEGWKGASSLESDKRHLNKCRREILAHCQKLVAETLKEQPEGFNMGTFKSLYSKRYGYSLDLQKLGYQKLVSLLQTMPGVRIESNYVLPAEKPPKNLSLETAIPCTLEVKGTENVSNSDSELSDTSRKDDDIDSVWEELGPISETSSRNNTGSRLDRETDQKMAEQLYFDNASLSDAEFSDSEVECPILNSSEGAQGKFRRNDEDSSLLQTLDSWYNCKDDTAKKGQAHNDYVNCSRNGSMLPGSSGIEGKSDPHLIN